MISMTERKYKIEEKMLLSNRGPYIREKRNRRKFVRILSCKIDILPIIQGGHSENRHRTIHEILEIVKIKSEIALALIFINIKIHEVITGIHPIFI